MNINLFSPYIRVAMRSYIKAPFLIRERIIFDYEIIFIESGCWNLTIEGKTFMCKKNDIILICPNQKHKIESVENISVSQPHIHFDFSYDHNSEKVYVSFKNIDEFTNEEKQMIRQNIFSDKTISPIIRISELEYFKSMFYEIIDIFSQKPDMYQLLYKEKMLKLIYFLFTKTISMDKPENSDKHKRVFIIKEYIDNNYRNNITLNSLSKQFYMDKFYIEKGFKKQYGMPVIKYHNFVRLKYAKDLLFRKYTVGETSELLGFNSIYSFSRFFKTNTGMSPTEYIKEHLKE